MYKEINCVWGNENNLFQILPTILYEKNWDSITPPILSYSRGDKS